VPLGSLSELFAEIDYNYRSEFFFTKENDALFSKKPSAC
jgi:hypothetical protein